MVSEELSEILEKIKGKIEDGQLSIEDLEDYMKIFSDICNNNEDIADEIDGWNRTLAFKVRGVKNFWMKVQDGKFSWGMGDVADADLTLEMDEHVILGIFSGEVDATAAYMSEDLKVTGPLTDAIKFRTLTEIVTDEFGL